MCLDQQFRFRLAAVLEIIGVVSLSIGASPQAAAQRFPGTIESAAPQTVTLEGTVRAEGGRTLGSGAMVRLMTDEGLTAAEQPVNTAGQFLFSNLAKIIYVITVSAEGFQTWQQSMDLGRGSTKFFVNVSLTPQAKSAGASLDVPSVTDGQAPKKARKEYEKGSRALQARNLNEARSNLEKAVAEYPCYARAQTDLALALSARHEAAPAEAALKKAIECDPGFLNAYAELGQLLNAEKKFADSQGVIQQGLRRSPGSWQFYSELAASHYGLGQYRQAEEEYLKAQSLNASPLPELLAKLADVYLKEGDYDKAYAEMQQYLRSEPGGRFAPKVKTIMQQMESSGVLRRGQAQTAPEPASHP